jgi:hypothetical protein
MRFKHTFQSLLEFHGAWETEFDTGRRFIKKHSFRYWECGRVDLTHSLDGAPDQRERLARRRGLHVCSSNEYLPFTLLLNGEKLPKAWLNPCQLLFDTHAEVVVCCESNWRLSRNTNVTWLSDMAFPIPAMPITITVPDRKKEIAIWNDVFNVRWHEARTLLALQELPSSPANCSDDALWDPTCRVDSVMVFLAAFNDRQSFIDRYIKPKTNTVLEKEFLRYTSK